MLNLKWAGHLQTLEFLLFTMNLCITNDLMQLIPVCCFDPVIYLFILYASCEVAVCVLYLFSYSSESVNEFTIIPEQWAPLFLLDSTGLHVSIISISKVTSRSPDSFVFLTSGRDVPFESFMEQSVHTVEQDRDGVYSLQYSLDGSMLVIGFGDGSMEVSIYYSLVGLNMNLNGNCM